MRDPSREFILLQEAVAGRFSIDRELGRGGMGIVFLARDVSLDRLVAIKLLPAELASHPDRRARFLAEARMAAGLAHPNIVPIHNVEERDDAVFYVMGFVDGETLGDRIRSRGALPLAELLPVLEECAWALGHAHAEGVVHRDVKPDNVLIERGTGRTLVTDFGIASAVAGDALTEGFSGTPRYMSPEQATGAPPDPRSDIYSFGVMAYAAAAGRPPFIASNAAALMLKHQEEPADPVTHHAPGLPSRLGSLIDKCLAKDPAGRFGSFGELSAELAAVRNTLGELPAPVRSFIRESEIIGREVGSYLATGAMLVGAAQLMKMALGDFLGIVTGIQVALGAGLLGLTLGRLPQLWPLTRALLGAGYDHKGLVAGLRTDEVSFDASPEKTSLTGRWLGHVGAVGFGALVVALSVAWLNRSDGDLSVLLGLAGLISGPVFVLRHLTLRTGMTRWWSRLLKGSVGRWFFRIAGIGLQNVPDALPTAGESTIAAVGHAAADMFDALPEVQRRRFPDALQIIARLEADAVAARGLPEGDARRDRCATAVAALESLRLDLLRLHAGGGSLDDLTEDLESARQLAEDVHYQIEAERDVRRVLERTPG